MGFRQPTARRWLCLLAAFFVFVLVRFAPLPPAPALDGEKIFITAGGRLSLGIALACLVLWATEAIPFAITGLLVFLLLPATGIVTTAEATENGLGHPLMLFMISLFFLAAAFSHTGLSHRAGNWIMIRSGGRAKRLLFLTLVIGALLSSAVTALGSSAILVGMSKDILERVGLAGKRTNFARGLLIACCWGPMIGTMATPAGAGSNLLVLGYLADLAGTEITFLDWMKIGVPVVLVLAPLAALILLRFFPPEAPVLLKPEQLRLIESENHVSLTLKEKRFLVILFVTFFLWIFGPSIELWSGGIIELPLQTVGLAAALVLFLPGLDILPWKAVEQSIPWGVVLILAGGLASGFMLFQTGAARWLAWLVLFPIGSLSLVAQVAVICAGIALLRLLFPSSTASASILVPLIVVLAQDLNTAPWLFVAPAAFATNIAFLIPAQAAAYLAPFAEGYFSPGDMTRPGLIMSLAGFLLVTAVVLLVA